MKFYLHCEDPELTLAVKWEDKGVGKIKDLLQIFCDNFYKRYPQTLDEELSFNVKNSKGKLISLDKDVSSVLKDKDDVFVVIEKNESATGIAVKLNDLNISQVDGERSQNDGRLENNEENKKSVDGKKNAATIHLSNQRIRKAIQIYNEILTTDKNNLDAIKGLVTCYMRAEQYTDGVTFCRRGLAIDNEDTELLALAGECNLKAGNGNAAVEHLLKLCKILRHRGVASASEKQDIQVLLAQAYLAEDQKDMAITILQGVLRENQDHSEALAEYAAILYNIGNDQHKEEAVSAILTALVNKRNDKHVKQKFAEMMKAKDGIGILKKVAANVLTDASALIFLAIAVRDFGGIDQALDLLETAVCIPDSSSVCVLTYIHTLELVERHHHAMKQLLQYCQTYPGRGVGNLTCSHLVPFLETFCDCSQEEASASNKTLSSPIGQPSAHDYSDEDLYILAIFFTVIKIFYIKGCLTVLPPLIKLLQPFFDGRDLHLTLIRNEAAYYKCISEVMTNYPEISSLSVKEQKQFLYFVGDSHCISPAWQTTNFKGTDYTIFPILSTGTKIWHLRPESVFYPKTNFMSVIGNIPNGAIVTTCLGEIDCRESFLQCWEKAKYDTIEDAMRVVVTIFIKLLKELQQQHKWTIFVHPVLPVLDITRPIIMQFNRILATRLQTEPTLKWLNFVTQLCTPDGASLLEEYKLDGTHIHPRYLRLFTEALNQYV